MSRLSKNILYNLAGQGLLLILSFVAVRFIFRGLGGDAVGIIYFAQTMSTMLFAVLEMGIGSTTIREVSAHIGAEPDYIRDFIRTGSLLFWAAYVLLALVIFALAPLLVHDWIHLKGLDSTTAVRATRILGVAFILVLPKSFYASVLRGLQRMDLTNLIDVGASATLQFGIIVALFLGGDLLVVARWMAGATVLGLLAYLLMSARLISWHAMVPGFSLQVVRRNFHYASRMAFVSLLGTVQTQADRAVASKFLPLGAFGYYAFAYSMVAKGALVTGAVAQAALPALCELYKAGDRQALMSQYRKLHDLLCSATLPIFAAVVFASVPLFKYVLNAEAARMLLLPTAFLAIGFFMNGTLNSPYVVSLAVGRPDIAARLNFYALFAVLPVTIVLVYFFGLAGAGFSWVFYHLFGYAYGARRICRECLQISPWGWYLHVIKFIGCGVLTYGAAWAFQHHAWGDSIPGLVGSYLAGSAVFAALAYYFIGEELRLAFRRFGLLGAMAANTFPPK
jgi:O-antigen/teichoic acid export membrane protein